MSRKEKAGIPAPSTPPNHRNVLVCVSGLSPAVITETYYCLAMTRQPPVVIDDVVVITTGDGKRKIHQELLGEPNNRFADMARQYGWPEHALTPDSIKVPQDRNGNDIADVRTNADFAAFADKVLEVIVELTDKKHITLYASLAGGRKTMSFYLGQAMNLFGRYGDSLSHVLLKSEYEGGVANFYYPGQSEILADRKGEPLGLDANVPDIVELSEFPLVSLNQQVNINRLRNRDLGFNDVLEIIRDEQAGVVRPIQFQRGKVTVRVAFGLERLNLPATEAAVLVWLGWRQHKGLPPVHWVDDPQKDRRTSPKLRRLLIEYQLAYCFVKNKTDIDSVEKFEDAHETDNAQKISEILILTNHGILRKVRPLLSNTIKRLANVSSVYTIRAVGTKASYNAPPELLTDEIFSEVDGFMVNMLDLLDEHYTELEEEAFRKIQAAQASRR